MNHIIIARYNEDIEWVEHYLNKKNFKIFIYNKNDSIPEYIDSWLNKNENIYFEQLKNVGREGHTYLYHIIKNIDNLGENNIFTQAEPFDHILKGKYAVNEYFYDLINNFIHNNNDFKGFGYKHYRWMTGIGTESRDAYFLKKIHGEVFKNQFDNDYRFNNGGIFGVKKKLILNRSIDFYKHTIKYLEIKVNPRSGFALERLWCLIFNEKYISNI